LLFDWDRAAGEFTHPLDGLSEGQMFSLYEPSEVIAARTTTKAMIAVRRDVKAWCPLFVKRTQSFPILQRQADQRGQRHASLQISNVVV